MKKKKWLKTAICLAVGVVLLTVAVFANYDNANGYSVCKKSVREFLKQDNYVANGRLTIDIDGTELGGTEWEYRFNPNGNPKRYSRETSRTYGETNFEYIQMIQDGKIINIYHMADGETRSYVYQDPGLGNDMELARNNEKVLNFLEVLCDTFVGDLKNTFYLAESKDGNNTYTVDLKGNQMPELVTAGVAVVVQELRETMLNTEDYESYRPEHEIYGKLFAQGEPFIDAAHGTMTVNADGLPTEGKGSVSIFGIGEDGNGHTLTITLEADVRDYGTCEIEKTDLNALKNVTELSVD